MSISGNRRVTIQGFKTERKSVGKLFQKLNVMNNSLIVKIFQKEKDFNNHSSSLSNFSIIPEVGGRYNESLSKDMVLFVLSS